MRITRDLLLTTATDIVKRETFGSHDLVCVYVTGSLTGEDPLIGGTTDIDLIYVHSLDVPVKRELSPLAEDFHLDITHFPQSFFSKPRSLRSDAWVGSFLCDYPIILHDTNHWFDYVRSGVFAHFFQPMNIIERVKPFAASARQGWMALNNQSSSKEEMDVLAYLKAIKDAANAVACLSSVPLTDRRLLIDFPGAAQAVNRPGLVGGLVDLIMPPEPIEPDWDVWVGNWEIAFSSIQHLDDCPLDFSKFRRPYYEKAVLGLKEENGQAALWLLLWTWAQMAAKLPGNNSSQKGFQDVLSQLALGPDQFTERISSLDQFLDAVEETIDLWQESAGL